MANERYSRIGRQYVVPLHTKTGYQMKHFDSKKELDAWMNKQKPRTVSRKPKKLKPPSYVCESCGSANIVGYSHLMKGSLNDRILAEDMTKHLLCLECSAESGAPLKKKPGGITATQFSSVLKTAWTSDYLDQQIADMRRQYYAYTAKDFK